MSIPDPTIDPVTGLPLLNPSDVVQQIPLGVQAFPWQDMGATSLPTRGPLYGDDILPVSAFVAGQHPQTGSAQTVQTDGAHALLVKDVNPSGGGTSGPIWDMRHISPSFFAQSGTGFGAAINIDNSVSMIIYQICINILIDPAAHASATPFGLKFDIRMNNASVYDICTFLVTDNGYAGQKAPPYQNYVETSITERDVSAYNPGGVQAWNLKAVAQPGFVWDGWIAYDIKYSNENT